MCLTCVSLLPRPLVYINQAFLPLIASLSGLLVSKGLMFLVCLVHCVLTSVLCCLEFKILLADSVVIFVCLCHETQTSCRTMTAPKGDCM